MENSLQNYVKICMPGINELMNLKFRIKEINHRKIKKNVEKIENCMLVFCY